MSVKYFQDESLQSETERDTFIKHTVYRGEGISVEWQTDSGEEKKMPLHEIAVGTDRYTLQGPRRPFPVFFAPSGKRNPRKLKIPAFFKPRRMKRLAEPRRHSAERGSIYRNSIKGIVALRFRVSVWLARRSLSLFFISPLSLSLSRWPRIKWLQLLQVYSRTATLRNADARRVSAVNEYLPL